MVDDHDLVKLLTEGKSVTDIFLDPNFTEYSLERIKELESIVKNENPVVKFDEAGRASILNYNVPNSTSYKGLNYIILRHPKLEGPDFDWFRDEVKK